MLNVIFKIIFELSQFKRIVLLLFCPLILVFIALQFYISTDKQDIIIDPKILQLELNNDFTKDSILKGQILDPAIEQKIDLLLSQMSLEQKVAQMILIPFSDNKGELSTQNVGALTINSSSILESKRFQDDLLNSLDELKQDSLDKNLPYIPPLIAISAHHGVALNKKTVVFPLAINLGAAADVELIKKVTQATIEQAHSNGAIWLRTIATTQILDQRSSLVERIFSEDVELNNKLSQAHFNVLKNNNYLFEANNWLSSSINVDLSNQLPKTNSTSLNTYLTHNQINALNAGAKILNLTNNSVNTKEQNTDKKMINYIKNTLGFNGIVLSSTDISIQLEGCWVYICEPVINAGVDMIAFGYDINDWGDIGNRLNFFSVNQEILKKYIKRTTQSVKIGRIKQQRIDDSVRRILRVKFSLGLFDDNYVFIKKLDIPTIKQHQNIAKQAVIKSAVLLKNNNNVLPIKPMQKVLITGIASNDRFVLHGIDFVGVNVYKKNTIKKILTKNENVKWVDYNFFDANYVINSIFKHTEEQKTTKNSRANRDLRLSPIKYAMDDFSPRVVQQSIKEYNEKIKQYILGFDKLVLVLSESETNGSNNVQSLALTDNSAALLELTKDLDIEVIVLMLNSRGLYAPLIFNHADSVVTLFRPGTEIEGLNQLLFTDDNNKIQIDFTGKTPVSWPKYPCDFNNIKAVEGYDPFLAVGYGLNYKQDLTDYVNWPIQIVSRNQCVTNARRIL
ncbi:MAG: glycoside hydrolase family 3 C-terminal domain-containing protein [Saccharospirillaceae bacterium]|nr:glycoside hydrolase family 3 C-terminal domain-containing protein [Pseudomonadales bacterium]NRB78465.1 glycoside hydrolase family 3 C-terminal domain-containing protein [Saccharospirillaceae bacterium]